ncbi:ATP-binding cassette domain-containing protein [Solibacillus silvestris]|uniref:ATP-binding cassette domain-containing protein n=1 Tax=Solibacillus silvestris TaxID=76853 RepID=UPI003F7E4EF9
MILKEISLSIFQGEKVAITGNNGSGKSSLLKLIGGIFEETAGQVKRSYINVGYVPEHFPENIRFKLQDYLILVGKMTCKSDEDILKRIGNYAELFAITDFLTTPLNHCSKGTKQKAGIIQALLKKPDLLLLDEPLTGLDDNAKIELLNQLNSLQREKTIIFTAHEPLLIEGLADRVITVESGRIIYDAKTNKKEKFIYIKAKIPTREIIGPSPKVVDDKTSCQGELIGMEERRLQREQNEGETTGSSRARGKRPSRNGNQPHVMVMNQIIEEIPAVTYKFIGPDSVEIIVPAQESDEILAMLLKRGCSIFELTEKR